MRERARIYLHSGSVIELVADKFTIKRNKMHNAVTEINWEGRVEPEPLSIDLMRIEAVVIEDVEEV